MECPRDAAEDYKILEHQSKKCNALRLHRKASRGGWLM
jgi:hypothetical protein